MHSEDRSVRPSRSSKSSVWIDPAYMRPSYVSEEEVAALSSQPLRSDEVGGHPNSTWDGSSPAPRRPGHRQPDPITPTPPTLDMPPTASSPIPPRASAQRGHSPRVPVKYVAIEHSADDLIPDSPAFDVEEISPSARTPHLVPPRQSQSRQTRKLPASLTPDPNAQPAIAPAQQWQAPVWQYDSPDYEIESSIAALSLVVPDAPAPSNPFAADQFLIDELPTRPEEPVNALFLEAPVNVPAPIEPQLTEATADLPTRPPASPLADVPTRPELRSTNTSKLAALAELDTVPPPLMMSLALHVSPVQESEFPTQALIPAQTGLFSASSLLDAPSPGTRLIVRSADFSPTGTTSTRLIESSAEKSTHDNAGLASWTAGGATRSPHAQRLIERRDRRKSSSSVHLNPLDRMRWWLLKPGHIEFMVWLAGTILLITLSLVLLFTTSLDFGWLTIGPLSRFSSSPSNVHPPLPTIVADPKLKLVVLEKGPFQPGQSIHLRGQGFTPDGNIFFTYDNMQSFSAQGAMTLANKQGEFSIKIALGTGQLWYSGQHLIEARDLVTGKLTDVKIMIVVPTSQTGSNGTHAPGSTAVAGKATPTPVIGNGNGNGNNPTPGPDPVGQTPVPVTPTATVGITPTPTLSPSPSPTATNTPTPTPTATPTSTPTPPPPTSTPGVTPTPTP